MKQIIAILCLPLLILTACNSDDGGGGPSTPATGTISATNVSSSGGSAAWTLPQVTGKVSFFNLTITATNPTTGELLILNMPNNGVGIYFGEGINFTNGVASYFATGSSLGYASAIANDNAFYFVEITSIDSVAKLIDGTFQVGVINPDDETAFNVFTDGTFSNVPYTGELDGVNMGGSMSALANGSAISAQFLTVFDNFIQIQALGITESNGGIGISFPYLLKSGTYPMGFSSENPEIVGTFGATGNPMLGTSGTLVLNRNFVTQVCTGTFEFIASDGNNDVEVTSGTFNFTY